MNIRTIFSQFFIGGVLKEDERSWKETLKLFIPFVVAFFIVDYQYLTPLATPVSADGHSISSLNFAYQKAYCGKTSHIRSLFAPKADLHTPADKLFGGEEKKETNCTSNFYVLNETSLGYLFSSLFKIIPSIDLFEVASVLKWMKISALLLFAFLLIRIGISPLLTLFLIIMGHFLIYNSDLTHRFSTYPFFIPNFVFLVSLSLLYLFGLKKYAYKFIPFGFFIGLFAAYYFNFRTSHALVGVYVLGVLMLFSYVQAGTILASKLKAALLSLLCLGALYGGFKTYDAILLKPIHREAKNIQINRNYTYHVIAHPLVLSLGLLSSDLTLREGIKWKDSVGLELANRIDPSVNYLGENYEKALFAYYMKLWIYYPYEMYKIYKIKFLNFTTLRSDAGLKNGKKTIFNAPIIENSFRIASMLSPNWKIWMVFFLSIGLIVLLYRKLSILGAFLSVTILGSFFLFLLESIIIMQNFVLNYHSLVNFLFFSIVFYYLQMAVNCAYSLYVQYQKRYKVQCAS